MRNALAVMLRILRQFKHDRRTLFMMIIAPIIGLFILDVMFGSPAYEPLVLTEGVSAEFSQALEDADVRVETASRAEALARLEEADADAFVRPDGDSYAVWVEGSDPSRTGKVVRAVASAMRDTVEPPTVELPTFTLPGGMEIDLSEYIDVSSLLDMSGFEPPSAPDVTYVHGSEDMEGFDFYGPVFIGIFVFFFVFITSGISFVRERTGGTLERVMATPIRRWQIVLGYILGFGVFSLVQTLIVALAAVYWVGFTNTGSFLLVLVVAESMALVSLTLGILVSEYASTELQVIQLLQIIVIPQILLSGAFDLSQTPRWMQVLSKCFPVTYGADAMRDVMLRGRGIDGIAGDLAVLWAFALLFFVLNIVALRKYRRI